MTGMQLYEEYEFNRWPCLCKLFLLCVRLGMEHVSAGWIDSTIQAIRQGGEPNCVGGVIIKDWMYNGIAEELLC